MSVAVSPDGRTLAVDLQGSIWTLPSAGGTAKRITDVFNDARQPTWSPDGKWIAFFAYRDGGYDLWAIAPDGTNQHKLTWGAFDDREPMWSHDGTRDRLLVRSRRPARQRLQHLDAGHADGELQGSSRRIPPTTTCRRWSPDDTEIAFASTRGDGRSVWAVKVADGSRAHGGRRGGPRRRAVVGAGRTDRLSRDARAGAVQQRGQARATSSDGKTLTGDENVFAFRASWASPTDFYYVSDGKIRKRTVDGGAPQTVDFSATLQVTRAAPRIRAQPRLHVDRAASGCSGVVAPVISPDGKQIAFAALGDIYVMPVGGKPVNLTKDAALDTEPAWSPDGSQLVYSSDKDSEHLQLWIRDMKTGRSRQLTHLTTQPQGAAWSPDGTRIAFFNVDGMWRVAQMSVIDVATGKVTKVHDYAAAARHADLVARRQAPRHCRHRADDQALPRGHQPGPHHVVDRAERRQVVRAGAAAVDRLARRLRTGVVARRHQDGRDL